MPVLDVSASIPFGDGQTCGILNVFLGPRPPVSGHGSNIFGEGDPKNCREQNLCDAVYTAQTDAQKKRVT